MTPGGAADSTSAGLTDRLPQLEAAHQAGLISEDGFATKRRESPQSVYAAARRLQPNLRNLGHGRRRALRRHDNWTRYARPFERGAIAHSRFGLLSGGSWVRIPPGTPTPDPSVGRHAA